jgi:transposase-like protein
MRRRVKMAQKKYTTEYKLSIVDRIENGESRNSVSKKTGLSSLTIKSWIDKKDQLINTLFEEARNRKKANRKKRYNDRIKELVVKRIEDGESVYKVSKELGIPYLTIKNWVIVSQNEKEPASEINIPDTSDVIISEEEKKELISYMEENAKKETPEDSMLRSIDRQNEEIAALKQQISELHEEIDMLKKAAIAFAKLIPSDLT